MPGYPARRHSAGLARSSKRTSHGRRYRVRLADRIERRYSKHDILEAYLNLVDWGHGNYGVGAAARSYFHTTPARLTSMQAARLAAVLPDPDKWNAARPGPYVAARSLILVERAGIVTRDNLDFCVK